MIDQLGVVDAKQRGIVGQDDAGRHDRPGQTAATDFVGAGDAAETKIAEPALHR